VLIKEQPITSLHLLLLKLRILFRDLYYLREQFKEGKGFFFLKEITSRCLYFGSIDPKTKRDII